MSQFMYFRESKPKLLSPNSLSTMTEITPTTVSLWKYQRCQRTNVLCAITPTAERLSKEVYNNCVTVCVITHTHTHTHTHTPTHTRSHGRSSLAGKILWGGNAEKVEVASPLMTTYGENSKMACLSFVFSKTEQNA